MPRDILAAPALYWTLERIETLKQHAEQGLKSGEATPLMLSWLCEFALLAPSWLAAEESRTAMTGKLLAMQAQLSATSKQVEQLVQQMQSCAAPPERAFDTRWLGRLADAPSEPAQPAERPPVEVDPPDPERPPGEAKPMPAGMRDPAEVEAMVAKEKEIVAEQRKSTLGRALDKMADTTKARVVGGARPYDVATGRTPQAASPALQYDTGEEGFTVHPNPDELPPDEPNDDTKSELAQRPAQDAPAEPAADAPPRTDFNEYLTRGRSPAVAAVHKQQAAERRARVTVKRPDGKASTRSPRTGYKQELEAVEAEHGPEVADHVLQTIGKGINTKKVRDMMARFGGTWESREAANAHLRAYLGDRGASYPDGDVLRDASAETVEHESGEVSYWRADK